MCTKHRMSSRYVHAQSSKKKQALSNGLLNTYIMKFKILIIYIKCILYYAKLLRKRMFEHSHHFFSKQELREFSATFCVMMTPPG